MNRVLYDVNTGSIRDVETGELVCYTGSGLEGRAWADRIVEALNRDAPPLPTAAEVRGIYKKEIDHE